MSNSQKQRVGWGLPGAGGGAMRRGWPRAQSFSYELSKFWDLRPEVQHGDCSENTVHSKSAVSAS